MNKEEASEEEYINSINQVFPADEEEIIQYNYSFGELKEAFLHGDVPVYGSNNDKRS